jgi:hypothetical protein
LPRCARVAFCPWSFFGSVPRWLANEKGHSRKWPESLFYLWCRNRNRTMRREALSLLEVQLFGFDLCPQMCPLFEFQWVRLGKIPPALPSCSPFFRLVFPYPPCFETGRTGKPGKPSIHAGSRAPGFENPGFCETGKPGKSDCLGLLRNLGQITEAVNRCHSPARSARPEPLKPGALIRS